MLLGYHAVYEEGPVAALESALRYDFAYAQLDMNAPWFRPSSIDTAALRGRAEAWGVGLSFHAPGDNISLFTDIPPVREAIIDHLVSILELAQQVNARHVTIHAGVHPSFRRADGYPEYSRRLSGYYQGLLKESLEHLIERSGGVKLCLENFRFDIDVRAVAQELIWEGQDLWLCWDIPKSYGRTAEEEFLRRYIERVAEVHVHDVGAGGESHLAIGSGVLDFRPYRDLMRRPTVAVTIEVRPAREAAASREVLIAEVIGAQG